MCQFSPDVMRLDFTVQIIEKWKLTVILRLHPEEMSRIIAQDKSVDQMSNDTVSL